LKALTHGDSQITPMAHPSFEDYIYGARVLSVAAIRGNQQEGITVLVTGRTADLPR